MCIIQSENTASQHLKKGFVSVVVFFNLHFFGVMFVCIFGVMSSFC